MILTPGRANTYVLNSSCNGSNHVPRKERSSFSTIHNRKKNYGIVKRINNWIDWNKKKKINLCSDDFLYIKRLIINSSEKQEKYFYRDSFVEKKVLIKYYNNLVSLIPIVILFSTTFQRFERNWNLFSCFITSNCISIHRSKLLMKNMSRLIDKLME